MFRICVCFRFKENIENFQNTVKYLTKYLIKKYCKITIKIDDKSKVATNSKIKTCIKKVISINFLKFYNKK